MPMRPLIVLALLAALPPVSAGARPWPGLGFGPPGAAPAEIDHGRGREMGRPRMDMPPPIRRSDQDYAREAMRAGAIRPLRDIARQWRGDMPGYDYIGSEYDPSQGSYRLKFLREGSVVWVDVDGRGREIRRSGR